MLAIVAALLIPITTQSAPAREEFLRGRDLMDAQRWPEAQARFAKALELDPRFAQAAAYLGRVTSEPSGEALCAKAVRLAADLPEVERLLVDEIAADRRREHDRARTLLLRIARLAPDDWRAQFLLGDAEARDGHVQSAVPALRRAIALNPKAPEPYNSLAYLLAQAGEAQESLELARKYVELRPGEPNPVDSLADMLLMAGDLPAAQAEFEAVTAKWPGFWIAWTGLADVHFLRGEWKDGREALAKGRAACRFPDERAQVAVFLAWSFVAEGKPEQGLEVLAQLAKESAGDNRSSAAWAAVERSRVLLEMERPAEALQAARGALAEIDKLSAADVTQLRWRALLAQALAAAAAKDDKAAQLAADQLVAEARRAPQSTLLRSAVHLARGAVAQGRGDSARAREEWAACDREDAYCLLRRLRAGDAAARDKIATTTRRDLVFRSEEPMWLYARTVALRAPSPR